MTIKTLPLVVKLTERRKALGLSQRDLDERIGVSESMVAKWESGMRFPTVKSLERWAKALGLAVHLQPTDTKKRKAAA